MQVINVSELNCHPRNQEFFDDISGDNWIDFLNSIKTSGVIEAITINQDKTIVSGHQRVRACKELGIKEIAFKINFYEDDNKEDKIIKDLIETNIKQRGIGNPNPVKFARCIVELERLYGIRNGSAGGNGSNQYNKELEGQNVSEAKTQDKLAEELGTTKKELGRYKQLLNLIPELQELVGTDKGKLKPTTAIAVYSKLSKEEQKQVLDEIGEKNIVTMTKDETEKQIASLIEENEKIKLKKRNIYEQLQITKKDYDELKKKKLEVKIETKTVTKEVIPDDVKEKLKKLDIVEKEVEQLRPLKEKFKREEYFIGFQMNTKIFLDAVAKLTYKETELKTLPIDVKDKFNNQIKMMENCIDNLKLILN